ncbi:hypothetical protein VTI74DRAFT_7770 [Chaetomium olivicolor]
MGLTVPSTTTQRQNPPIFLFAEWLPRYNLAWLAGDSVAGLTVGFVVIPQAMAYALLAGLSPEYGLYTSFVGAVLYWVFGTSKDIVIGTTAVGSLLVGSVVASVQEQRPGVYSNEEIAKTLSAVSGTILLFIGLVRLGWIVDFIPYIPISAFVTAASITIMATQFPVAMGIPGVNTREAPYLVIVNSLKGLPETRIDAAIGLSSIVLLHVIRYFCTEMEARDRSRQKVWAMISSLRLTFSMLLYTLVSWLVNRNNSGQSPFRIVGHIEKGFQHAGAPPLNRELVTLVLPELPAVIIILVIEHIAIAKSFGRTFNYTVVPSQEILAQGASNLLGTFVGGYVCTGSFGASAVLSKAGVRTPLAGLFSAVILLLALHVLTAVFYYIPNAALAGLIIHAVANLPTPLYILYKYWRLSPPEFIIWIVGVVVAIFVSLEVSVYVTISISLALVLVRLARTNGRFLGQTRIYRINPSRRLSPQNLDRDGTPIRSTAANLAEEPDDTGPRDIYLPLDHHDGSNPDITISPPAPGVFIYRFPCGLNYMNQEQHMHRLVSYIKVHTRFGSQALSSTSDDNATRLWSDPGPLPQQHQHQQQASLPRLRAVVLDCTAVDSLDITSVQGLVDAQKVLDRHAHGKEEGEHVALAVAGFGTPRFAGGRANGGKKTEREKPRENLVATCRSTHCVVANTNAAARGKEKGTEEAEAGRGATHSWAPVRGLQTPYFHVDLTEAVNAAVREARTAEVRQG